MTGPASHATRALLPPVHSDAPDTPHGTYDRVADVLLIGFATTSLPAQAADRFGVELTTINRCRSSIGETPVERFRLGLRGTNSDAALGWIEGHGGMAGVMPASRR